MKRIFIYLMLLVSGIGSIDQAFASHGMGGEITWTCLANGQYKFKMKFYRDCNGITPGNPITMKTNHPIGQFTLNLVQQNDISPNGIQSNGVDNCPDCVDGSGTGGTGSTPIAGLVEEYIYESGPITLAGVPPVTGWWFRWGECCRSGALVNMSPTGFANRAYMFPYNGQNANPCFDNSPYFSEKPSTIICTGFAFKYNPAAVDAELDSLVYDWATPIDDQGNVVPFLPGYSVTSQLPGPIQNPSNIAAQIDPQSGEMTYTSYTGGYFVTCIKVTAYKCGQKVAEIYREINVVLNNNCPPVLGGVSNKPPTVTPPFIDPVTGTQIAYADTFYAGDTVQFSLTATDFNFFTNGSSQKITIEAYGSEFGNPITNPNAGCPIKPCATLDVNTPVIFNNFFGSVNFFWPVTCDHVKGKDTVCTRISNTYRFVIKASDNYCPANASNVSTISITILAPPAIKSPPVRCADVNVDGSVDLTWSLPAVKDSQGIFNQYMLYASSTGVGPYTQIDSIFAFNSTGYSMSAAQLNSFFGTNAQQQSIHYYLKTRSGCDADSVSQDSIIISTIKLDAVQIANKSVDLSWNPLTTPPLSSHSTKKYQIYRQFPIGSPWVLIDSTNINTTTYNDPFAQTICDDFIAYRVDLADSVGCVSRSSIDTVRAFTPAPQLTIAGLNSMCAGQCVTLTASAGAVGYAWSTGATTQSITVCAAGNYTVTADWGACITDTSKSVTVNPLPTPNITGNNVICDQQVTSFNAGVYSSYLWNTTATTASISVGTAGTYTVTVTDPNGCTGTDTYNLIVNPLPTPSITGNNVICANNFTIFNAGVYSSYQWSPGGATTQTINLNTAGNYTVTVTDPNGCTGTDTRTLTVNALPVPNITGVNSICQGTNTIFDAGAYSSYQWNTAANTQTITIGTAGTYTVTVTDANGCTGIDDYTLTVNPNPVPNITGNNVICDQQSTIFDAGVYSSYQWNTTATTQTVSLGTAGTYTVTVTDANGCTGTDTYNLTVNALPVPNITGNNVICANGFTIFNAGVYAGYQWSPGGATTQTININTQGNYSVIVTDGNGCTGTDTRTLTVNALPVPNITGNNAVCDGFTTIFDAGAYNSYQWNTAANTQTITIGTAGTYTVTVTDANGCTGTDDYTLTVNPNPVPNITGINVICDQQSTVFDAGAYSTYTWNTGASTQTINVSTAGTYTVTVVDANGCEGTDTYALTVNALPTATISGVQNICDGQATTFNITFGGPGPYDYTYSDGTSAYGPFSTASGTATINVSPNVTTNYTLVSIINPNTTCVGTLSGTATVNVTPLPTAQITGTTDICIGSSTNLQVAFTGVGPWTYTYTSNGTNVGPFTTANNPDIISVNPNATTTYGLTATVTGAGCVGATLAGTAAVTVNPLPTSTLSGNNVICNGESTDIIFDFTGTGPFTYTYTDGTNSFGPFTTVNNPAIVSVAPSSTLTYSPTLISDLNCSGNVAGTANVVVNPLPTALLTGTAQICDGFNTNLEFTFTGTGPYTYTYSDGTNSFGPYTTNLNPVLVSVNPNTNTTYTPIGISDANCTGTALAGTAAITVVPIPTGNISGTTAICQGSTTNLDIVFTGQPPFEYKYTDGTTVFGTFTTNLFNISVPVAPSTTTTYTLVTTTGNGCAGPYSGSADITVNAIPDAVLALSGNPELCFGESSEFTINFTGTGPFTYTYFDGTSNQGPFIAASNPEVIPVTPGTTTNYSLVSINDVNCNGTIGGTAQVVVHPLPTASASGNQDICDGSSTSFNINFTGTGPYTYTYTDGGVVVGPLVTNNNPEVITVSPAANNSYTVTTVSDLYCTGTAAGTVDVNVHDIPTAVLTGNAIICYGESTDLDIQFTGTGPFNYTYSNGTNNIGPLTSNNASLIFPVSPGASTSYTLVAINDVWCPGTFSGLADVTVNPLPTPLISGDLSICEGETSALTANAGYVTYNWSNGETSQGIVTGTGGGYTVTVIDLNGCTGTSPTADLVVNMVPVVSFTNDTALSCETTSINFINTSLYPSGSQFLWNFGDGTTSTLANPSHVYADSGTYQVYLSITTDATCFNDTTQTVEAFFYPLPIADFTADPWRTEVFNGKVKFTDLSQNAVSWNWNFGDGDQSDDQYPTHYFGDVGEFKVKLTVVNVVGCEDHIVKEIVVNPFYIPNAFTPNGDGTNEYFFDAATGYNLDVQSFRVTIFNRWGQAIFETDSFTNPWNGTDRNGNKVPDGVYVYKIEVTTKNFKKHLINGTVTLLR